MGMSVFRTTIVSAFALAGTAAPALAGQSRPVTDFNGTYTLACDRVEVALHAAAAGVITGQSASWSGTIAGSFDCSDDDALAAVAAEARTSCLAAGLPVATCAALEAELAAALAGTVALVPVELTVRVTNAWDFWARLFGVYQVAATHTIGSGATVAGSYLLDNNDGRDGTFGARALDLAGAAAQNNLGCADLIIAGVDGRIARADAYALTATAAVDRTLTCLAVSGADALTLQLGLTLRAHLDGMKP